MSLPFRVFRLRLWLIRLVGILLRPWLGYANLPAEDVRRIESLYSKGLVVYILRSASLLDVLFLDDVLRRHRLRPAVWTNAIALWSTKSKRAMRVPASVPGIAFMHGGGGIVTGRLLTIERKIDAMVDWARHDGQQIYLVPIVSVWQKQPEHTDVRLLDIVFGRRNQPGIMRRLYWLVRSARTIAVRTAHEIDLTAFTRQRSDLAPKDVARRIRLSVNRHFASEEQAVIGPPLKSPETVQRLIVKSAPVQRVIEDLMHSTGQSRDVLEQQAQACVREIAATYDIRSVEFLGWLLSHVWSIIFTGFHVDLRGLDRVRAAMREGPVLIVPAHRSHIDYLFISYVFKINDLPTPHIAAGINLSFWPLGPLFRRAGAFFLRRTFAGDALYKMVFQTYLQTLLRDGFNIEFFVEGTRSRSGRIMPPRFGMLQMLNDSFDPQKSPRIKVIPVGIDYEMLVEQNSIEQELLGKEKQAENLRAMLGLRKKLKETYGSCYLAFGEPMDFHDYRAQNLREGGDKEFVERLGYDIVESIARTGTVTWSAILATALCIHHKRGIERDSLDRKIDFLTTLAGDAGARFSSTFPHSETNLESCLQLFLRKGMLNEIQVHGKTVYMIPDERRLILDYYKNNLLHHLAPLSVAAWAFRSAVPQSDGTYDVGQLAERYQYLWRLIGDFFNRKFQVIDRPEFERQLAVYAKWSWVRLHGDSVQVIERKPLMALENLLINYYESLYVVALTLVDERKEVRPKSAWLASCLEVANMLYAKGDLWRFESRSKANIESNLAQAIEWGWLRKEGDAGKKKRDQQPWTISEARFENLKQTFDTLHDLVIDRKYLAAPASERRI